MCALYKAYNGERSWIDIGVRLQSPYHRSRGDHCWKIRTDVGKLSFVNKTIPDWNRLPEGAIRTSLVKTHVFRKRVRKVWEPPTKQFYPKCQSPRVLPSSQSTWSIAVLI
jgi:hypothetical protein